MFLLLLNTQGTIKTKTIIRHDDNFIFSYLICFVFNRYYVLDDGVAVENDDRHSGNQLLRDSLIAIDRISKIDANMIMKSVNVIIKRKNLISGHSDSRVDGLASRF